ncbi:MAG: endolytic transglycosylase MltG [Syntrophaceticus sp.]|nr:endolytic transglycosylase MltG [Syntrophaceticus sp.]
MKQTGEESWLLPFMVKLREILSSLFKRSQHPLRFAALILVLGSIGVGVWAVGSFLKPVCSTPSESQIVTVTIDKGSTLSEIGQTLADSNVIRSSRFFVYYGRLTRQDKNMQAGTYQINNSWSMKKIVECISSGEVATNRVTIPEGFTVKQIENLLVEKEVADRTLFQKALDAKYTFSFLEGIPDKGHQRLEGFLFPATYELRPGMSEEKIIEMMLQRFQKTFTPQMEQRADEIGFSVREVVTLASIVEREAKLEEERSRIAAVFLNRLNEEKRLESCATVQYILGKQKEELTNKDLQNPSPYNTYLHMGLPPGPIANPGLSSINAVLHPADVDYLFFVAKGDGSHHFSVTFTEHQKAARHYQK